MMKNSTCFMDSSYSSFNESPRVQNLKYATNPTSMNDLTTDSLPDNCRMEDFYTSNTFIFTKELTDLMFLLIELHDSGFKVCIRQFKRDSTNSIRPTSHEIIMDLFTWYDFFKKLFDFDLIYSTSSFVANNNILVLNSNSEVHIQNLTSCKLQSIKLNENQFELLKEIIPELNNSLINFLFTEYLPHLIRKKQRCVIKSWKSENLMTCNLITWIEHDLANVFKTVFQCSGCKMYYINPLNHECITFSNLEKYNQLGEDILLLVNIDAIISNFLSHIDFVTEDFLCNINVEIIKNLLFK